MSHVLQEVRKVPHFSRMLTNKERKLVEQMVPVAMDKGIPLGLLLEMFAQDCRDLQESPHEIEEGQRAIKAAWKAFTRD
jgi:hypothetical protein